MDIVEIGFYQKTATTKFLKDESPVNALRAQNLASGHFW